LNPPSRDGHTAVVYGDRMYIFGGFEEENQRFSQETYYFDFITKTWGQLITEGEPPQYRDFHTACVIEGRMYIFGGRSDEMGQFHSTQDFYCDRLKCLDLQTAKWIEPKVTGDRPCGRRSHSVWVHNGKMYLFGGFISTKNRHFNDVHVFDPKTNQWRRIEPHGSVPSPRRRQCTVVVGDRVFLFGGTAPQKSQKVSNDLMDLGDLHVLDYAPTLRTLCLEAVIKYDLVPSEENILPLTILNEIKYMRTPNKISKLTSRCEAMG
jgi:N-acetylneuraminic acid mutarotase